MKECKIVCDGKEMASVSFTEDGMDIKCTKEGKKMCEKFKGCCC